MQRSRLWAFTLIELLVVILILGILIALLMPAIATAWQMAEMTQCKTNLNSIYKAQGVWSAERVSGILDGGWAGRISAYLDQRASVLKCPSSARVAVSSSGGSGGGEPPSSGLFSTPEDALDAVIEQEAISIGVLDASGRVLYEIPLAPSPYWTMYAEWWLPDGRKFIEGNLDNDLREGTVTVAGYSHWGYVDNDFSFVLTYENGYPTKIEIWDNDSNANSAYTDFRINHKPIWGGQKFSSLFAAGHSHEVVDIYNAAKLNGTLGSMVFPTWTVWSTAKGTLGLTNYGISRGCYQKNVVGEKNVLTPDPNLFFILDYPKAIADYSNIEVNDLWDQIFIAKTPPTNWTAPAEFTGCTWQEVQALRHFGMANVLFCDGHIESLTIRSETTPEAIAAGNGKYLDGTSPLWRYTGR